MRSLPLMLSCALALTTLIACDKKDEAKKDADKKEDKADKDDGKADAKKAGEPEESAANAVDADEEGCIHDKKEAHAEGESCDHAAQPSESTGHFGAEFALAEAKPLSAVLASGVPTEAVKVSGTVDKVCQKMGCWMVIKDGEAQARVLVKDHAFAIPMDGEGKAAQVEGTLEVKELSEANVAHLKKDGDSNLEGDEARQEYFLHATAVELSGNS